MVIMRRGNPQPNSAVISFLTPLAHRVMFSHCKNNSQMTRATSITFHANCHPGKWNSLLPGFFSLGVPLDLFGVKVLLPAISPFSVTYF